MPPAPGRTTVPHHLPQYIHDLEQRANEAAAKVDERKAALERAGAQTPALQAALDQGRAKVGTCLSAPSELRAFERLLCGTEHYAPADACGAHIGGRLGCRRCSKPVQLVHCCRGCKCSAHPNWLCAPHTSTARGGGAPCAGGGVAAAAETTAGSAGHHSWRDCAAAHGHWAAHVRGGGRCWFFRQSPVTRRVLAGLSRRHPTACKQHRGLVPPYWLAWL